MYILELTNVSMHGLAAAAFALMYALGGSAMALLGALHPLWRWNMVAMAGLALVTLLGIAIIIPESPTWLARKGKNKVPIQQAFENPFEKTLENALEKAFENMFEKALKNYSTIPKVHEIT